MSPILDPDYLPMIAFERQYWAKAEQGGSRSCILTLVKSPQQVARQETRISLAPELEAETLSYLNRLIKSMLWIYGGSELYTDLPAELVAKLHGIFCAGGQQEFDATFIVKGIFGKELRIVSCRLEDMPASQTESVRIGGKSGGLRLGFDLGGSDKKIAAIVNEQVVFSQSIIWDPYPQTDLAWHRREIRELLELGASKLPGPVAAVGGSVPGIVMNDEIVVGSLFRGLEDEEQRRQSRTVCRDQVRDLFGEIPFHLTNDGDVTALAGAMLLQKNNLLGIAMGTSEAAGYANAQGSINSWFSELAFVPVDMGQGRSQDEWSKDWGTGAEYFSQQAVIRLAGRAGIELPADLSKPKKLVAVQERLRQGHQGAANIFRTIGCYLGYALPWYHRFYQMKNVLLLGRVLRGEGGKLLLAEAQKVLAAEFPQLQLALFSLGDEEILHGQARAAASLA